MEILVPRLAALELLQKHPGGMETGPIFQGKLQLR